MVTATNKKATTSQVTSAMEWKKDQRGVIDLPSGKTARLRRTSIQTLMAAKMIPNNLMGIVQEALNKGKLEMDPADFLKDPDKMSDMLELVDIVVVHCVLEPVIHATPKDEDERDDDLLYVDEIDDEDRSFIFQYATGGTSDVAKFRAEASEQLGSIQSQQTVSRPAKRAAARRG